MAMTAATNPKPETLQILKRPSGVAGLELRVPGFRG